MAPKPRTKRPVGRNASTAPLGTQAPEPANGLPLPHERDESTEAAPAVPDPVIVQAKRDLDAGMADTDMRATPGLDAELRRRLVPGAGGKPPSTRSKP